METVNNYQEFLTFAGESGKAFLLLYKNNDSASPDCAFTKLTEAADTLSEVKVAAANVAQVRDIHEKFQVTSVPALLELNDGKLIRTIKGCHEVAFYKNTLSGVTISHATGNAEGKPQKNVVVYSTPSCSWCNTLKTYLREHQVAFRDVDVSRDQKAAEEMVKRSGQQGVPQTVINGELIIGFDKAKIDKLLQIQSK